jgi:diacylglycerol kinase family enzyme
METLRIGSRDQLNRGELSVYFARGARRRDVVTLACRSLIGRLEQSKTFEMMTTREFEVATWRRSIDVSTDGEVNRLETPLHFRTRPRALRVIAAPPAEAASNTT